MHYYTHIVVVGPFIEIKTGYRGFETNEIQYFVCLSVCSKNYSPGIHESELITENGFRKKLLSMKTQPLLNIK